MVAQRWTVFFIFLVLCTFEAEFKDFGVCKKKIIKQLKDAIAALENCDCNAKSCAELYKSGKTSSGVYTIDPDGSGAFDVFCDQTTAGGGWTVLQKRLNGSVDFYRDWAGSYSGSAGDSLSVHSGQSFTTKDQDHDSASGSNCAVLYKGAWWYKACHRSNLNGFYHQGGQHSSYADGVNWYHWKGYYYSMKRAEMKIRPVNF
ncbi:ryncolin-2-like [Oculina patagonica]